MKILELTAQARSLAHKCIGERPCTQLSEMEFYASLLDRLDCLKFDDSPGTLQNLHLSDEEVERFRECIERTLTRGLEAGWATAVLSIINQLNKKDDGLNYVEDVA